ncbi:MAG: glycine dehydrogenase (aminomethyl-transferring), partial [Acidimicrobiales bacterium]
MIPPFAHRHIGPDGAEIEAMLAAVGVASLDALVDAAVPASIRQDSRLALPEAGTEEEILTRLRAYADRNQVAVSMLGMGYSGTLTPTVILRNVMENPAWYTAYTPYQPEISQGRLEALLNFQTMITDLTGMDLANASLLDEATAAAEAMALCRRVTKRDSATFFVDAECHPQTIEVVATRAEPLGIKVIVGDPVTGLDGIDAYGVLVQYPGTSGGIRDLTPIVEQVHEQGGLVVVAADLLALTLLEAPGAAGADVVVGSSQRFGVTLGYGGPHAAYMSVREVHARSLPGRLVGV